MKTLRYLQHAREDGFYEWGEVLTTTDGPLDYLHETFETAEPAPEFAGWGEVYRVTADGADFLVSITTAD